MIKVTLYTLLIILTLSFSAYAADGATIITEEGVMIRIKNGYQQLKNALSKNADRKKQILEINIEGETLHLNLDHVSLLCRDDCRVAEIIFPKKNNNQ